MAGAITKLDVVISAYRETRATELLSALSRVHEVVPLRAAVVLHNLSQGSTLAWLPGGAAMTRRKQRRDGHHTNAEQAAGDGIHDYFGKGGEAGRQAGRYNPAWLRICKRRSHCSVVPRAAAAAYMRELWGAPTPYEKVVITVPNVGDEASAYLTYVARQLFGDDEEGSGSGGGGAAGGGEPPIFTSAPRRPERAAFLHAHADSWHNDWSQVHAILTATATAQAAAPGGYRNLNEWVAGRDGKVTKQAGGGSGGGRMHALSRPERAARSSFWRDLCVDGEGHICSAPSAESRQWLYLVQARINASALGPPRAHDQGKRKCMYDRSGKAGALRDGWTSWTGRPFPGALRMDCCAQFVVPTAHLIERGGSSPARFWRRLAALSVAHEWAGKVPWEYMWRGLLEADQQLGGCAAP